MFLSSCSYQQAFSVHDLRCEYYYASFIVSIITLEDGMIMKETKNPRNHSIHLPQSFLFVSAGKTDAIAVVGDAGRKANDKESRQVTGCNTRGKQALSITGRNTTGKQTLNMGETQQVHKLSSLPADARSYTTYIIN